MLNHKTVSVCNTSCFSFLYFVLHLTGEPPAVHLSGV